MGTMDFNIPTEVGRDVSHLETPHFRGVGEGGGMRVGIGVEGIGGFVDS
jgi:hypothetical protein